jgi:hypothetical protein
LVRAVCVGSTLASRGGGVVVGGPLRMKGAFGWLLAMTMLVEAGPRRDAVTHEDVTSSDIILVIKHAKDGTFTVAEEVRGNGEFLRLFLHLLGRLELTNASRDREFLYLNRRGRDPLDPLKAGRFPEIIGKKYLPLARPGGKQGIFFKWRTAIEGKDDW